MFNSTGRVVYDPRRVNMRKNKGHWWCILEIDSEIARYYRWFWWRATGEHLSSPAWHPHVTVVNGVKPPYVEFWRKYEGASIDFSYDGDVYAYLSYVAIDVYSDRLAAIREQLGLRSDYPFHVTIGRTSQVRRENPMPEQR